MKRNRLILILVLLSGCHFPTDVSDTWVLRDVGVFRVQTPENWRAFPLQGIDSRVGGLTDGQDTLLYDYGWYSYRLQNETSATHQRIPLKLDGRAALLVRPLQPRKGTVGIYAEVDERNRFVLTGRNLRDEETAVRMMKSVEFD